MPKYGSFSDAIRAGAMLRPQCFDAYYKNGATCAFGAGLEALAGKVEVPPLLAVEHFGYLMDPSGPCPACCSEANGFIAAMIYHLNDDHKWTRQQIADWLQTEEDKLGYVTLTESESECLSISEVVAHGQASEMNVLS